MKIFNTFKKKEDPFLEKMEDLKSSLDSINLELNKLGYKSLEINLGDFEDIKSFFAEKNNTQVEKPSIYFDLDNNKKIV
jgi:hypothetical protein